MQNTFNSKTNFVQADLTASSSNLATPLAFARSYIDRDCNPTPIPFRSKVPIGDEWQKRVIDHSNVEQHFNGAKQNIGIIMGPTSKGLTDVDLDCREAIELAPVLLPKTPATFGRKSKRFSHYLYRTNLAETVEKAEIKHQDPTRGAQQAMLVELRIGGNKGCQTVFPGSVHESGEDIVWEESGEPASVDGAELKQKVALLAASCLIARYWPGRDSNRRHEAALVVGGFLARAGQPAPLIKYLVERIARTAGDDEVENRKDSAYDAAVGFAQGKNTYGFPAMAEIFGDKVAKKIADWIEYSEGQSRSETDPEPVTPVTEVTYSAEDIQAIGLEAATATEGILKRFIVYPSDYHRKAHTLWIMHTHAIRHFDTTPRLAFLSPEPASGKSRALEITERLVLEPVTTINTTPAYLFRKIGDSEGRTAILFDEIDTVFGPKAKENEEVRGVLNAGYRRGATAGRCVVTAKGVETEEIPAFAPVAMGGLGWLPDTILSRSIIVRMRRRAPNEKIESYRRRLHDKDTDPVLADLTLWGEIVWPDGLNDWPDLPDEVQDRDADIWEPLIAIADAIGGDWPQTARAAAVALVTSSKNREASLGIRLLSDLKTIFGRFNNPYGMKTADLLVHLAKLDEAPWGDLKGKPLDARGLAMRLKEYDIEPDVFKLDGTAVRGYRRSDFRDAWNRYLVTPEAEKEDPNIPPEECVTDVTGVTPEADPVTGVTDVTDSAGDIYGDEI